MTTEVLTTTISSSAASYISSLVLNWETDRLHVPHTVIAPLQDSAILSQAASTASRTLFHKLPLELVWHILQTSSTSSTDEGKTISLVCKYARHLALPSLFSVRSLRDARAVQDFLAHVQQCCPLTPVGPLVTSLWLTVTRAWPVETVRAVIRACPNLERLALTNISALAPWAASTDSQPLFADAKPGAKLELTLVGQNSAADLQAFVRHDPVSAAKLATRLTSVQVLKLRSAFHARPSDVDTGNDNSDDGEEGIATAMLQAFPNIRKIAVPYGQVAATMEDALLESTLEKELELLKTWVVDSGVPASTEIELLVNSSDLEHLKTIEGLKKKENSFGHGLRMVDWPRNVDAARERWLQGA